MIMTLCCANCVLQCLKFSAHDFKQALCFADISQFAQSLERTGVVPFTNKQDTNILLNVFRINTNRHKLTMCFKPNRVQKLEYMYMSKIYKFKTEF